MTDALRDALYRAGVEQMRIEKEIRQMRREAEMFAELISQPFRVFEPTRDERRKVTH